MGWLEYQGNVWKHRREPWQVKTNGAPFVDVLALLIFGTILFPNVDGLVDLAAIDAFLAFHDRKESPVVAILADLYDTFDWICEKNSAKIVFYTPALYISLVSHLFHQEVRHVCPLEGHRSCAEKKEANWHRLLASKEGASVSWFPRWKEGRTGIIISCRGFPNVHLNVSFNNALFLNLTLSNTSSLSSILRFIRFNFKYLTIRCTFRQIRLPLNIFV